MVAWAPAGARLGPPAERVSDDELVKHRVADDWPVDAAPRHPQAAVGAIRALRQLHAQVRVQVLRRPLASARSRARERGSGGRQLHAQVGVQVLRRPHASAGMDGTLTRGQEGAAASTARRACRLAVCSALITMWLTYVARADPGAGAAARGLQLCLLAGRVPGRQAGMQGCRAQQSCRLYNGAGLGQSTAGSHNILLIQAPKGCCTETALP